jgi:predicted DsbA family dithiol-disulfide isomerase
MSSSGFSDVSAATATVKSVRKIKIDIVSDTICPWCYVGKRRIEKAMKLFSEKHAGAAKFSIAWHPFFLDKTLPKAGVDKMTSYISKFGEGRVRQMIPFMKSIGEAEGIKFSYGGKISNTLDSHRVMELSYAMGGAALQDAVCEALMKFYFEDEGDIGSKEDLVRIAASAGMPEADVRGLLSSPTEGVDGVLASENKWRKAHAITGVPFFVLDEQYEVSGAQDVPDLLRMFEKVAFAEGGK